MTERVIQDVTLVLGSNGGAPRVSQIATLVLGEFTTPIRVDQFVTLVLGREIKRRVISTADTGIE